ncbi:MAG: Trp biosynthesis-associated membrane protein, partial [Mycobacteriales bacterium]
MTARRELRLAVLLCLVGAGLVLLALSRTWATFTEAQRLTISAPTTAVTGRRLSEGAAALGYVGLAGVVALAATRRWGRVVVGVLVALAGAGVVVAVGRVLRRGVGREAATVVGGRAHLVSVTSGWAWLAVLGGAVLVVSGALVAARGRRWAALSSAYDAPAALEC